MTCTVDHLQIVLAGEFSRRTAIQIENHFIEATDNEQRRCIDIGEMVLRQIRSTTP